MVQKHRCVLWAKAYLKWIILKWISVLWSDESKFDILVGNHGHSVLLGKRGGRPSIVLSAFSSKASISDGMGNLHVLEGTMNAERYINVKLAKIMDTSVTFLHLNMCHVINALL